MASPAALRVMEIQRFSLHDGPGIRTTVFLKGCPLECPWCANPESLSSEKQLMYFKNKCVSCGECIKACAFGAAGSLSESAPGSPSFTRSLCTGCESCAKKCPKEAVSFSGRDIAVEDILDEVMKDRDYYEFTGGGLTVSGGEPFIQAEALNALLSLAKKNCLHTAVETCGNVQPAAFKSSFENVDLFLFDLKHHDALLLEKTTGGDLNLMLDNLAAAVKSASEVIARIPLIPGFNGDQKTLSAILELAKKFGVTQVHLLPYHLLGRNKYEQLGIPYKWSGYAAIGRDEARALLEAAACQAVNVKIP